MPIISFRAFRHPANGETLVPVGTPVRDEVTGRIIGVVAANEPIDFARTASFSTIVPVQGLEPIGYVTGANTPLSGSVPVWTGDDWDFQDKLVEPEEPSKSALERLLDDEDLL